MHFRRCLHNMYMHRHRHNTLLWRESEGGRDVFPYWNGKWKSPTNTRQFASWLALQKINVTGESHAGEMVSERFCCLQVYPMTHPCMEYLPTFAWLFYGKCRQIICINMLTSYHTWILCVFSWKVGQWWFGHVTFTPNHLHDPTR